MQLSTFWRHTALLCCLMTFTGSIAMSAQGNMNNRKLEKSLRRMADRVDGHAGSWQLYYKNRILLVLTDDVNNRMRIFTPIIDAMDLDPDEMHKMLEANFHSALDAKYCLSNGFVVAVFNHPLRQLRRVQLFDALDQVATLAENFGTTYSSTDLIFGEESVDPPKVNQSPTGRKDKGK